MENGVLWKRFMEYLDLLSTPALKRVCMVVLEDEKFWEWPGSVDKHHAGTGGLFKHTLEVLEFAVAAGKGAGANLDVVIPAAIWHDYLKIEDYEPDGAGGWKKAPYGKLIRHIVGSYAEFKKAAERENLDPALVTAISHAILAHHGRKEWGSPIEPETEEAWILHAADMWSAIYRGKK